MRHNEIELTVPSKAVRSPNTITVAEIFIEGRSGSEYEIEIKNNTFSRVEAVYRLMAFRSLTEKLPVKQATDT